MVPIHDILIKPLGGKSYDNEREVAGQKFALSVSNEDHNATQRQAEVLAVPSDYEGPVIVGDTIVVHHNTFRRMNDIHGKEKNSVSYIREGLYFVDPEMIYMYKRDGKWSAVYPYIFVTPVSGQELTGVVAYSEIHNPGTKVSFQPDCEYEFRIEGVLYYRMFEKNILFIH